MAAGAWIFPTAARASLFDGTFDLDSDTWKVALLTDASNIGASSTTFAGVTGEVSGSGYTAGGESTTISLSGTTTVTIDATDVAFTASGGSIVARYAAIYEVSGNVLCYCLLDDAPTDVTATDGNQITVTIHASGIGTVAWA